MKDQKIQPQHPTNDQHVPVMRNEILTMFEPLRSQKDLRFADLTLGRGGHSRAILQAFPSAKLWAVDQDEDAITFAEQVFSQELKQGRVELLRVNFSQLSSELHFDGILADLGVSSPQLDQGHRGFSFYHDGPLDMRMDRRESLTAAEILNEWSEEDLISIFKKYGEVRKPYRVVRALVHDRKTRPWESTREFAGLIERVEGWRKKGSHPATLYFQALRLVVNRELQVLEEALPKWIQALRPSGRLAVLTFHSLEDRLVKQVFRGSSLGRPVNKKVITAGDEELTNNPRSRSAKLRVFEKKGGDESIQGNEDF